MASLTLQVAPFEAEIIFTTEEEIAKRFMGERRFKKHGKDAGGITDGKKKEHRVLIFIPHKKLSARNLNTISHESSHAIGKILHWVGAYPKYKNDEVFCYYQGWLLEQIVTFLRSKPDV